MLACLILSMAKGFFWNKKNKVERNIQMALVKGPGNKAARKHCVFPFFYNEKQHNQCIGDGVYNGTYTWCATELKDGSQEYSEWGECIQVKAKQESDKSQIRDCALPFKYEGEVYDKCASACPSSWFKVACYTWCPLKPENGPDLINYQPGHTTQVESTISADKWGRCMTIRDRLHRVGATANRVGAKIWDWGKYAFQKAQPLIGAFTRRLRGSTLEDHWNLLSPLLQERQLLSVLTMAHPDLDVTQTQHTLRRLLTQEARALGSTTRWQLQEQDAKTDLQALEEDLVARLERLTPEQVRRALSEVDSNDNIEDGERYSVHGSRNGESSEEVYPRV